MLADAVPKIEAFVYTEWQVDHMPWFTDHGPGHSERVAAFAMDLGTPTKIHPDLSRNLIEKFVLWSAAWLHDIGMQQLLGTALGGGNETIYGRIRSQHPDQSSIVILNKAQLIGLPPRDAPLIGAIAYVARAHGTAYYEESVSTLETSSPYMHGKQIRGGLLAAILLMADEIDLGHERALRMPMPNELNTISNAHALKHDCVQNSSISHLRDGNIQITIHTSQFPGIPNSDMNSIEGWILEKLWRQIAKTERQFASGFDGQARISRAIVMERRPGILTIASPEPEVMAVIEADNTSDELINHRATLSRVQQLIDSRTNVAITGRRSQDFDDEDGREDLLGVVLARQRARGRRIASSICLRESGGAAGLKDVVIQLALDCDAMTPEDAAAQTIDRAVSLLAEFFAEAEPFGIIAVSCVDWLKPEDQLVFLEHLIPRIGSADRVSLLVSGTEAGLKGMLTRGLAEEVDCLSIDRAGVEDSLAVYIPRNHAVSEASSGLRYFEYAKLRQNHIRTLLEGLSV